MFQSLRLRASIRDGAPCARSGQRPSREVEQQHFGLRAALEHDFGDLGRLERAGTLRVKRVAEPKHEAAQYFAWRTANGLL